MGQKVNPIGFRLGITRTWDSIWYEDKKAYTKNLHEDLEIKKYIKKNKEQKDKMRFIIFSLVLMTKIKIKIYL